jgi:hypothetical protein
MLLVPLGEVPGAEPAPGCLSHATSMKAATRLDKIRARFMNLSCYGGFTGVT